MTQVWTMDTVRSRCQEIGECLIWSESVTGSGYPSARINGKPRAVRQFVYFDVLGRSKKPGYRLTVRCGNVRCVSEHCIVQATLESILSKAMQAYRQDPGNRQVLRENARKAGLVKNTAAIAAEIRTSTLSVPELMERHGLSRSTVKRIQRGVIWKQPANSIFNLGG